MKRLVNRYNYWIALLEDCMNLQARWWKDYNDPSMKFLEIYQKICLEYFERYRRLRIYISKRIEQVKKEMFAHLAYETFTNPLNWSKHIDLEGFDMIIETGSENDITHYEITIGGQTYEI